LYVKGKKSGAAVKNVISQIIFITILKCSCLVWYDKTKPLYLIAFLSAYRGYVYTPCFS